MSEWVKIKLIRLAEFINGYGFKPNDWGKEGLPIIRIEQLKNPLAQYDYFPGKLPEKNIINDGDLIFSWSASLFLRIWDRGEAALNQHLFKVIPNDSTDILFLKYLIESNLDKLLLSAHGSTMQHITRKELENFDVYIAESKPEQTRIAQILSTADKAIEQTEKLIAKYQRIKTGLMQGLLTKGIDEHGNIRSEKTHRFKTEKGLRVPEEWEVGPITEIAFFNPQTNLIQFNKNDYVSFFRMEDVSNEAQVINRNERRLFEVVKGFTCFQNDDTLIAKITPCLENGKGALMKNLRNGIGFGSTEFHILRPKDLRSVLFIFFYSTYTTFRLKAESSMSGSAGQQRVQRHFFETYLIGIPPLNEQKKIGLRIKALNDIIKKEMIKLSKLQSLKTGLMQDLLSGKVRVKMSEL